MRTYRTERNRPYTGNDPQLMHDDIISAHEWDCARRELGAWASDQQIERRALERESALHAQMAVLASELTKAADLLENIGEQLSGVGNRHMAYACGMRKASASAALAKVTTTNTIPTGELK